MTITLPPEIEKPLAEAAKRRGMTPESLALEELRHRFPAGPGATDATDARPQASLFDLLGDYIGAVDGPSEALSENCGKQFANDLVERHRKGKV